MSNTFLIDSNNCPENQNIVLPAPSILNLEKFSLVKYNCGVDFDVKTSRISIIDDKGEEIKDFKFLSSNEGFSSFTALSDNKFLIVFIENSKNSYDNLYGKIYDIFGNQIKDTFLITDNVQNSTASKLSNGNFIVAYGHNFKTNYSQLKIKEFYSNGNEKGQYKLIEEYHFKYSNGYGGYVYGGGSLELLSSLSVNDGFYVFWKVNDSSHEILNFYVQKFNNNLVKIHDKLNLHTSEDKIGHFFLPKLTMLSNNNLVLYGYGGHGAKFSSIIKIYDPFYKEVKSMAFENTIISSLSPLTNSGFVVVKSNVSGIIIYDNMGSYIEEKKLTLENTTDKVTIAITSRVLSDKNALIINSFKGSNYTIDKIEGKLISFQEETSQSCSTTIANESFSAIPYIHGLLSLEIYKKTYKENNNCSGHILSFKNSGWVELFNSKSKTDNSGKDIAIPDKVLEHKSYFGAVYQKGNEVIIAHRGTDQVKDWLPDNLLISIGKVPPQFKAASAFIDYFLKEWVCKQTHSGDIKISFTGHSLGGALAQLSAAKYHYPAITFDSPSVYDIINNAEKDEKISFNNTDKKYLESNTLTFNAAPNLVNTVAKTIGKVYRVYPEYDASIKPNKMLPDWDTYFELTKSQHALCPIISQFNKTTQMPKIYGKFGDKIWPAGTIVGYNGYDDFSSVNCNPHFWIKHFDSLSPFWRWVGKGKKSFGKLFKNDSPCTNSENQITIQGDNNSNEIWGNRATGSIIKAGIGNDIIWLYGKNNDVTDEGGSNVFKLVPLKNFSFGKTIIQNKSGSGEIRLGNTKENTLISGVAKYDSNLKNEEGDVYLLKSGDLSVLFVYKNGNGYILNNDFNRSDLESSSDYIKLSGFEWGNFGIQKAIEEVRLILGTAGNDQLDCSKVSQNPCIIFAFQGNDEITMKNGQNALAVGHPEGEKKYKVITDNTRILSERTLENSTQDIQGLNIQGIKPNDIIDISSLNLAGMIVDNGNAKTIITLNDGSKIYLNHDVNSQFTLSNNNGVLSATLTNQPPVANTFSQKVDPSNIVNFEDNIFDLEDIISQLKIRLISLPDEIKGVLMANGNKANLDTDYDINAITYLPNNNQCDPFSDKFTYKVIDTGGLESIAATVNIDGLTFSNQLNNCNANNSPTLPVWAWGIIGGVGGITVLAIGALLVCKYYYKSRVSNGNNNHENASPNQLAVQANVIEMATQNPEPINNLQGNQNHQITNPQPQNFQYPSESQVNEQLPISLNQNNGVYQPPQANLIDTTTKIKVNTINNVLTNVDHSYIPNQLQIDIPNSSPDTPDSFSNDDNHDTDGMAWVAINDTHEALYYNVHPGGNDVVEEELQHNGIIKTFYARQGEDLQIRPIHPIGMSLEEDKNIELIDLEKSTTYFDYKNDGIRHKTSWVGKDDAILFYDYNQTQQADDAKKIVITAWSQKAKTDFEALLEGFDSNQDKIFDQKDAHFQDFYLWQDKNSNGQVDTGELISLTNTIEKIDFMTSQPAKDTQDGAILNTADVVWKNGKVTTAYDLVFKYEDSVAANADELITHTNGMLIAKSALINLNVACVDKIQNHLQNAFPAYNDNANHNDAFFEQQGKYFSLFNDGLSQLRQLATNLTDSGQKMLNALLEQPFIKHTLLKYTYHNELNNIQKVVQQDYIQSSTDEKIRLTASKHPFDWTVRDYKLLKLAAHPDKGGNSEDFITIQNFQDTVGNGNTKSIYQDALGKISEFAVEATQNLYQFNIGVKACDTGINLLRTAYQPTQQNIVKSSIDVTNLYSLYSGFNPLSQAINLSLSGYNIINNITNGEYYGAATQSISAIGYNVVLPSILATFPIVSMSFMAATTGYNALTTVANGHDFCQTHPVKDNIVSTVEKVAATCKNTLSSCYDSVTSMFNAFDPDNLNLFADLDNGNKGKTENTQENFLHQTLMDTITQQNVDIADNQAEQDYLALNMLEMGKRNVNLSAETTDDDTLILLDSVSTEDANTCYELDNSQQDETVYFHQQDMPLDHVA